VRLVLYIKLRTHDGTIECAFDLPILARANRCLYSNLNMQTTVRCFIHELIYRMISWQCLKGNRRLHAGIDFVGL
jgi:hypothetical protein